MGKNGSQPVEVSAPPATKLPKKIYEDELLRLQTELVAMADWVKRTGHRMVIIFEGRDAAGKGGVIKRITEYVSPRAVRVVALPAPTERESTQWYYQRYIAHLPAAGEIVIFDRSWYNRGGVEKVMGFCTEEEHQRWLQQTPVFERMLVADGIQLVKYWFSVSDQEQARRFAARVDDPLKQWKLSPMDVESQARWVDYSKAKDEMFAHCDIPEAPWYVVESSIKRNARINCIAHLLSITPYEHLPIEKVKLPKRQSDTGYVRPPRSSFTAVRDVATAMAESPEAKEAKKQQQKDKKKAKKQMKEAQAAAEAKGEAKVNSKPNKKAVSAAVTES